MSGTARSFPARGPGAPLCSGSGRALAEGLGRPLLRAGPGPSPAAVAALQAPNPELPLLSLAQRLPPGRPLLRTMARGGRGRRLGFALGLLLALVLAPRVLRGKPTVRKERVVRPDSELGERPPEDNQSFQYDHEAFLGKEDSKTFDQLTPDESKERLG